jgi:hypothetical protein
MSALVDPMERVTQLIEISASSLRNDISTIVGLADAKFLAMESAHNATLAKIMDTSQDLFVKCHDRLSAMAAADDRHEIHVQQLSQDVTTEIAKMKNVSETFSDNVKFEIQTLRALSADHEREKTKMASDLADTNKFMAEVTHHLTQSGGQANGTRDMAMGLVNSHTEIHKLITDLRK